MSEFTSNISKSAPFFTDERFERLAAILITLITVLAAIVGWLQTDASVRSAQANRNAQRYAIQAMGRKTSGLVQFNYEYNGLYRAWSELDLLALSAGNSGDEAAARRYETVRDRLVRLSPLLQTPYFDAVEKTAPDLNGYEADIYWVEATALTERYTNAARLGSAWSDKANTYVAQLTILAVVLFLYGLSTTISGRVRWLFVSAGTMLAGIVVLWLLVTAFWPISTLADEAIVAYAQGIGLAYRGKQAEAIAAFDQALNEAPHYADAFYERGNTHFDGRDYEAAAADYEAAQATGRDDAAVTGNLGWVYYLLGRFNQASEQSRQALKSDPTQIGVHFNLGLALLADGQPEAAQTEYANTMALVSQQVNQARESGQEPSSSLWWYMDAGARDLQSLLDQLDNQPKAWTDAPPRSAIADPEAVRSAAQDLNQQLRDMIVALEYTGEPPKGLVTAQITSFKFGQAQYDEQGNFVEYTTAEAFPYGTAEVLVLFDYENLRDGQEAVWKVYRDGLEDPSLRLTETWSLSSTGSAEKSIGYAYSNVFFFTPGEYTVELYIDSHLAHGGTFIIKNS